MRIITKTITLPIDGTPHEFRLKKLDAFSGAALLRLLMNVPAGEGDFSLLQALPPAELRSVMVSCLHHAEVKLPAGWQPVMTGGEWAWPELEHDAVTCLRLTIEVMTWTLTGFFGAGGSSSRPAAPNT